MLKKQALNLNFMSLLKNQHPGDEKIQIFEGFYEVSYYKGHKKNHTIKWKKSDFIKEKPPHHKKSITTS